MDLVVRNQSVSDLEISAVESTDSSFRVLDPLPLMVSAGDHVSLSVQFAPLTLRITTDVFTLNR